MTRGVSSAARMEPLASLPVFFKLGGKIVVMAGADAPAVWKAELLVAAGAMVRVFSDQPCPDMLALADQVGEAALTLIHRAWVPADLRLAAMAIGSIEDEAEATRFRDAARAAGVPVNVVDKPAYCDFQFGTIVARSPLVIGISTDGAAPVFGQALRARIEAILPQGLQRWAQAAKDWRPAVQDRQLDFRARRRFWEVFATMALASPDREPTPDDQSACFAAVDAASRQASGRVTLVGSGRGTAESITLEAVSALQSADVVFYDPDVSPGAVGLSRREAAKRTSETVSDAEMATLLEQGKHVALLGTGDPATCKRWSKSQERLPQPKIVRGLDQCPVCPEHCRFPAI